MRKTLALAAVLLSSLAVADDASKQSRFQHPLIEKHGGIIPLEDAAEQPQKGAKALLDVTSAELSGGVIKAFDRAALICNQYEHAGVGPRAEDGLRMAIILHGEATKAALSDESYDRHSKPYAKHVGSKGNPNLPLLRELKKVGVEIFVCGQALAHQGYATDEVNDAVKVAVSAATVNVNKQMGGYAYLPFH